MNKTATFGIGAIVGAAAGAGVTYYICNNNFNKKMDRLFEQIEELENVIEEMYEYDVRNTDNYIVGGTIDEYVENDIEAVNEAREKLKANWAGKVSYDKKYNENIKEEAAETEIVDEDENDSEDDDDEEAERMHPLDSDEDEVYRPSQRDFDIKVYKIDEEAVGDFLADHPGFEEKEIHFFDTDKVYVDGDTDSIIGEDDARVEDLFGDVLDSEDFEFSEVPKMVVVNETFNTVYTIWRYDGSFQSWRGEV